MSEDEEYDCECDSLTIAGNIETVVQNMKIMIHKWVQDGLEFYNTNTNRFKQVHVIEQEQISKKEFMKTRYNLFDKHGGI